MINIKHNKRPIFYAFVSTLATYILIQVKNEVSINAYIYVILFNLILFIFEILSISLIAKSKLQQFDIPQVHNYIVSQTIIHFLLLPLLLFSSLNLFIFFNPISQFNILILILTFILYSTLFINIRAYFEDKFKLEEITHFIYPIIIIFSLFSFLNATLSVADINGFTPLIIYLLIFLIIFIFNIILFLEDINLKLSLIFIIFISSIIISAITYFLFYYFNSKLRTSFITSNLFYIFSAILFHKKDGTLSFGIILEYIVFSILNFTLLYGIS